MSNFDFSQPSRQSAKGIIVIFGAQLFKFVKDFFLLLIPAILRFINTGSVYGLSLLQVFLIVFGILLIILMVAVLKYLNFKFHISNEGFHLQKGIINKENIIIPRAKIQNVYIKQNLLQQLINVSSLAIETASDDKAEVDISALPTAYALELQKKLISEKVTEISEENETTIYYKASIGKLLLEGITNNHFKSLLVITTFFSGLYYENKAYLQDFQFDEKVDGLLQSSNQSLINVIIINMILIIVMLLAVMLFSIGKTFLINYNLQVTEQNNNLTISKGLLNKVNLNLLPSRIQTLTVTTNKLKQLFQLHTLHVKQAMTSKNQKENLSVVGLNALQVDYLVAHLFRDFTAPEIKSKPEFYFKRLAIIRSMTILLLLNGLFVILNDFNFFLLNFIAIPYVYFYIKHSYEKAFYSVNERYVTIESGFIDSKIHILEVHKIQSVSLTQTVFQKRRNIASLLIATASGQVKIPHIKEENAKSVMDFLLYHVEISHKNWM
jgi:putative membrane protein